MEKRFSTFFRSVQYAIQRGWLSGRPTGKGDHGEEVQHLLQVSTVHNTERLALKEANRER